jgi:hypothetical protein
MGNAGMGRDNRYTTAFAVSRNPGRNIKKKGSLLLPLCRRRGVLEAHAQIEHRAGAPRRRRFASSANNHVSLSVSGLPPLFSFLLTRYHSGERRKGAAWAGFWRDWPGIGKRCPLLEEPGNGYRARSWGSFLRERGNKKKCQVTEPERTGSQRQAGQVLE